MAFEGLNEKIKDKWADAVSALNENATFNNVREQFESQTPSVQRVIVGASSLIFVLLVLWLPWGYISTSQENMALFEENRQVIQGLLKASRLAKEPSPLPVTTTSDLFKSRIEGILRDNQLLPDQIGEIEALSARAPKELVPEIVVQTGLSVPLKRLTLNQIIGISHVLQSIDAGTKLMAMDITQSADQTHYYDVLMQVVQFSLPRVGADAPPSLKKRRGNVGGARRPPAPSDEEDGE